MPKKKITYERVHEVLDYNPETGVIIWKKSISNCIKIDDIAGSKGPDGYIQIGIDGKDYRAHRIAWLFVYGYFPEHGIDHRDRIRHHNWISNLRESSKSCNTINSGNRKDNTSGVKGINWHKQHKKWHARITINKKTKSLGVYIDFAEAVCARLAGEQCLNWSGCDSCSPAYKYVNENIIKRK